ncbi:hypothetical protein MKEN_01220900 [Mycena kentingensis (nom. inval.)]|nr:hypothetical protein MKEN_01220900 [Mycena kentingensis (nom. inval.)]
MPPSLRRSSSSPHVRSSPYTMLPPGTRPTGHRRSTGSETTFRRVLQDIEWYKVMSGQEPVPSAGDDQDEPEPEPVDLEIGRRTPELVPVAEMAALAITPRTPTLSRESSTSSVESTPEQGLPAAAERPFSFSLLDDDRDVFALPPALRRTCSDTSASTMSFYDLATPSEQYADFAMSPLSSPPIFSN